MTETKPSKLHTAINTSSHLHFQRLTHLALCLGMQISGAGQPVSASCHSDTIDLLSDLPEQCQDQPNRCGIPFVTDENTDKSNTW
jgi:hypothetical protein